MRFLRTGLIATAAALIAGTATVTAAYAQTSPTAARPAFPPGADISTLHASVNLPGNGTWTGTPLQVFLPQAGTYELDANVRGRLAGTGTVNSYITARLWNVTAGAEALYSERLVYQIINTAGGNATAPISELVQVTGPTTIQLQARDINATGAASIAQVYSDGSGYTTLRFVRVGP
jgi:hypothetical protein